VARKRRRHYRTCPPSRKSIKIYVGGDPTRSWKGFIEDVSSGGTRLSFPGEDHPQFALHQGVELQICSPYLQRSLVVPSIVSYRYEAEDRATYGFQLKKRPVDLVELPAPLKQVFNRRRDRRVQPAPERPVHAIVTASPDERFEALAYDISTSGISFVLTGSEGAFLVPGDPIDLELRLPGSTDTHRLKAALCARESVPGGLRLGACFQTGRSPQIDSLKTCLSEYVKERRREIARARRRKSSQP
jgi:hypothetical protein